MNTLPLHNQKETTLTPEQSIFQQRVLGVQGAIKITEDKITEENSRLKELQGELGTLRRTCPYPHQKLEDWMWKTKACKWTCPVCFAERWDPTL